MVESSKKKEDTKQVPDEAESPSTKVVKRNWADVEDEGDEEGDVKDIGGTGAIA